MEKGDIYAKGAFKYFQDVLNFSSQIITIQEKKEMVANHERLDAALKYQTDEIMDFYKIFSKYQFINVAKALRHPFIENIVLFLEKDGKKYAVKYLDTLNDQKKLLDKKGYVAEEKENEFYKLIDQETKIKSKINNLLTEDKIKDIIELSTFVAKTKQKEISPGAIFAGLFLALVIAATALFSLQTTKLANMPVEKTVQTEMGTVVVNCTKTSCNFSK